MSPKKNQQTLVECPSCGAFNTLGATVCTSCGDRLYQENAGPKTRTQVNETEALNGFNQLLNVLILCAVLFIIGLVIWPAALEFNSPENEVSTSDNQLIIHLKQLNEQGLDIETPEPLRITQGRVNRLLASTELDQSSDQFGITVLPKRLELRALESIGPIKISTKILLQPNPSANKFTVSEFWVGRLPLPSVLATPWAKQLVKRQGIEVNDVVWDRVIFQLNRKDETMGRYLSVL